MTVTVLGDTEVRPSFPSCRMTGGGMKDLQWSLHGVCADFLAGSNDNDIMKVFFLSDVVISYIIPWYHISIRFSILRCWMKSLRAHPNIQSVFLHVKNWWRRWQKTVFLRMKRLVDVYVISIESNWLIMFHLLELIKVVVCFPAFPWVLTWVLGDIFCLTDVLV